MGVRYSEIEEKQQREIVLLKSLPCRYGKCAFCDYIKDNSTNINEIDTLNIQVLKNVTGKYQILEVINSGSVFELTPNTLAEIKKVVENKKIKILYFEIYYGYRNRIKEIEEIFKGIEIRFKMGIETFDNKFRINVYNKKFFLTDKILIELSKKIYSICLLVCTKGQTKEMITKDIETGLKYFKNITINIFIDNGTKIKRDNDLVQWFLHKYSYLTFDERVELLIDNKDLGVFEQ